ncbi:uncharacterized protein B0H64DRAFT_242521 [Chaetomium fimeti]|uniref:Uncharacterized protein n=1 Tax=Chaetomium fimeti TaxID=1854472 RepID=A0AAE0LNE6_9PEZI|nr:hypothetical protein B0H64DRAFT_242521 [Chaetomium fimeti]
MGDGLAGVIAPNGPGKKRDRVLQGDRPPTLLPPLEERGWGRVAAFEVGQYSGTKGLKNFVTYDSNRLGEPCSPKDLLDWWSSRRYHDDRTDTDTAGRVIILEDLGRAWIDALCDIFPRIPFDFFARHWANPTLHNRGAARPPLAQDPRYHCVLSYTQLHDAKLSNPSETPEFHRLAGSAYRTISFGQDEPKDDRPDGYDTSSSGGRKSRQPEEDRMAPQPAVSQQLVSFWGAEPASSGKPWEAVILVDPPLDSDINRAIYFENWETENDGSGTKARTRWRNWERYTPAKASIPTLPKLTQSVGGKPKRLKGVSMFDDIVSLLGESLTPLGEKHTLRETEPSFGYFETLAGEVEVGDVGRLCCHMVMAKTAVEMQQMFGDAYRLKLVSALELDLRDIAAFNFKDFDHRAWNLKWEGRRFTRLWKKREELELLRYRLKLNIRTVENILNSGDFYPRSIVSTRHEIDSNRRRRELELTQERQRELELNWERQAELELTEWKNLELTADYADEMIRRTTESYLQTVAACQASAATAQANFVGQITKMASVFVPVSLIAAIFSMGGNFAAGSELFWIFWAVSMPVAVGLIAWMFGKDMWGMAKEFIIETGRSFRVWFDTNVRKKPKAPKVENVGFGMA